MKAIGKVVLLTAVAMAGTALHGGIASAQGWGPAVEVKTIDPVIRGATEVMGMVRTRGLVIGQVNLLEYVGKGTMVDLELATAPVEVTRYSYALAIHIPASRTRLRGSADIP